MNARRLIEIAMDGQLESAEMSASSAALESGPELHTVPRLKNALAAQMAQPFNPVDA